MRIAVSTISTIAGVIAALSHGTDAVAQDSIMNGQYILGVPFVTTPPVGDVLLQELRSPFSFTAPPDPITGVSESITGDLYSAVFSANGGSTRDFFYQFVVTSGTASVTTLSLSDFSAYNAGVGQSTASDIDGTGPFTAGGFSAASATDSSGTISFFYDSNGSFSASGEVPVGGESATMFITTNAPSFTTNNASIQSSVATNASILAPNGTGLAPEPNSTALLIPGGIALLGFLRRRKAGQQRSLKAN